MDGAGRERPWESSELKHPALRVDLDPDFPSLKGFHIDNTRIEA